ncbi:MAG TPA: neutral zinc metallopeptidase [Candidatus Limnocylindrales bacterium]|nr:neutral zinc metallopeptidase [Candidatus Limnocylindrales bacterium]
MVFNPRARLDPRQVLDRRGMGGAGGLAVGGGGIGLILVLAYVLLGGDPSILGGGGTDPGFVTGPTGTQLTTCQTGEDANQRQDCRIVGFVNSIQDYWTDAFAQNGSQYQPAETVLFDGGVNTACGAASSAVGPFYCPLDQHVYLDLGFYNELQSRFGAEGGPLAEGYVVAHEYGHHIENLLGVLEGGGSRDVGAESTAVRIELMADCLAGVWAHNAEGTGFLRQLTRDDIAQALDAAAAVGDDRIQERVQGQVTPETWTHGSSEQRQQWFLTGYEGGRVSDCDTIQADL